MRHTEEYLAMLQLLRGELVVAGLSPVSISSTTQQNVKDLMYEASVCYEWRVGWNLEPQNCGAGSGSVS